VGNVFLDATGVALYWGRDPELRNKGGKKLKHRGAPLRKGYSTVIMNKRRGKPNAPFPTPLPPKTPPPRTSAKKISKIGT